MLLSRQFFELSILSIPLTSFAYTIGEIARRGPALDVALRSGAIDAVEVKAPALHGRMMQAEEDGTMYVHGAEARRSSLVPELDARQDDGQSSTATPTTAAENSTNTIGWPFDVTTTPIAGVDFYVEFKGEVNVPETLELEIWVQYAHYLRTLVFVYNGTFADEVQFKTNGTLLQTASRLFWEVEGSKAYLTVNFDGKLRAVGQFDVQYRLLEIATSEISSSNQTLFGEPSARSSSDVPEPPSSTPSSDVPEQPSIATS